MSAGTVPTPRAGGANGTIDVADRPTEAAFASVNAASIAPDLDRLLPLRWCMRGAPAGRGQVAVVKHLHVACVDGGLSGEGRDRVEGLLRFCLQVAEADRHALDAEQVISDA